MKNDNEELRDEIREVIQMQESDNPEDDWLSTNV